MNMSVKRLLALAILFVALNACHSNKPYNESANARADILNALNKAKVHKTPVIVIFGANWCEDCQALNAAIQTGKDAVKISKEFEIVKVDIGEFDHNLDVANDYGNPIKGGIPAAAILTDQNKILYVTHPGELSSVRNAGDDGIYNFFKKNAKPI
jgi:protein disulfide-isomerase